MDSQSDKFQYPTTEIIMDIHRTLAIFALYSLTSLAPAWCSTTPETVALANEIEIADVHMHLTPESIKSLLEKMDRNGVRWGGAVGGRLADGPLRVKAGAGKRYIVSLGQAEYQAVLKDKGEKGLHDLTDPRFVSLFETAQRLFESKAVRVFGEIHINNVRSGVNSGFQVDTRFEAAAVKKMYDIANRYSGIVQIHSEGVQNMEDIQKVARDYPQATTILSHCLPFSRPNDIRKLFKAHANLMCELSATGPVHGNMRVFNADGPKPEWLELIEEFPDRFMLGTDPCCGLAGRYDEMVKEIRSSLLAHLRPSTIKKLANQNAKALFALED